MNEYCKLKKISFWQVDNFGELRHIYSHQNHPWSVINYGPKDNKAVSFFMREAEHFFNRLQTLVRAAKN
jgi:hypothetical protein